MFFLKTKHEKFITTTNYWFSLTACFILKTFLLNYTVTFPLDVAQTNLSTIYILVTVCVNKRAKEIIKDNNPAEGGSSG